MEILRVEGLCKCFGGLKAVWEVSFQLNEGEILGMIGPNGSGKTTVFNLITGVYKPTGGSIRFQGESIGGLPSYLITQKGMNRTFQNIRLFGTMTVLDNVLVGMHCQIKATLADALARNKRHSESESQGVQRAMELLDFMGLGDRTHEVAANLAYGEQRRLELARALANQPAVLLLDEPTAGMNPNEAAMMMQMIRSVRQRGITVFLIEHNMKVLMGISDRVIALEAGKRIAEGEPQTIQRHPQVIKAYLGTEG
ncbi:MAG: ABC transporter ATP-binding protein [Bacillota bacterium]|jgi:branched-chain amino acid transport system ATP-binding protein